MAAGLLGTAQMAGAFQMLRTNDLLWSRVVRDYLVGERAAPSELMSWNADATRMPYQMHSDYLRRLFLTMISPRALPGQRQAGRSPRISICRCLSSVRCATISRPEIDLQGQFPCRCRHSPTS